MACFCFGKPSVGGVPEGSPETWSKADVKQWFKHQGLQYTDATAVDGKSLVATTPAAWEAALGPKSSVLVKAITELKASQDGFAMPAHPAHPEEAKVVAGAATAEDSFNKLELTDRVTGESDMGVTAALQLASQPSRNAKTEQVHGEDVAGEDTGPNLVDVRRVFEAFASFGFPDVQTEMDSTKLMKLARECDLLDPKVTSVDVDLFFLKAKPVRRRITFDQFLGVISACADKKGIDSRVLLQAIINKGGPESHGVKAQPVRFHDDKSLYTGVAKAGGPTTVEEPHDLATILDRGSRRSTGNKHPSAKPPTAPSFNGSVNTTLSKSMVMSARRHTMSSGGSGSMPGDLTDLQTMFEAFASFGAGKQGASNEMDRSRFAKMCRDCGLIDSITADIVFSQHLKKGTHKLSYQEFKSCLDQIARDKGCEVTRLEQSIVTSGGPMINTAV